MEKENKSRSKEIFWNCDYCFATSSIRYSENEDVLTVLARINSSHYLISPDCMGKWGLRLISRLEDD